MKCQTKTAWAMAVVAVTCGLCLLEGRSPSWNDLTESAAQTCLGGTTCVVAGTQACPWNFVRCEYRYGPTSCTQAGGVYTCTAGAGDIVSDPYPAEANNAASPGQDNTSYDFNYQCAFSWCCNINCTYNTANSRWECTTSGVPFTGPITVIKSWPSGNSCEPDDEE